MSAYGKPRSDNNERPTPTEEQEKKEIDMRTQQVLQRQLEGLPSTSPFSRNHGTVFAYANSFDIVLIAISTISAIVAGALNPLLTVIYGLLLRSFQNYSNDTTDGDDGSGNFSSSVSQFTLYYVYLGIAEFVFVYIATVGFYHSGERITRKLRRTYLRAIIRQNMAFFDTLSAGEVTTHITSDMNVIQEGITSKISLMLTALATFLSSVVISFIEYWRLALILLSTSILLGGAEFLGGFFAVKYSRQGSASLGKGASVVEEALSSIRHVTAFGIQGAMSKRYRLYLDVAERWGIKTRVAVSVMIGTMNAIPYLSYGLAFWQGSRYIVGGEMNASAVVTTTMATIIGAFAVGRVAPSAESFISSIAHAGTIMTAIGRRSPLDPFSSEGRRLLKVNGDIEFQGINLVYPSRPDINVLKNVDLQFPANTTTALVGASGCGKSSILSLLERFYEPTKGSITLDGHDIAGLNLHWLRQQMSYVVQDPVLFNRSIYENILLGLSDLNARPPAAEAEELVHAAAKIAHAHDFITALPQGYRTEVGAKGLQLSGGQRQRICIARAVIGNPKILLLDEATSALDAKSERAVQQALESAAKDRTTIVVAHRLSTVRNADNIVVMSHGSILEQGRHDELMRQGGAYAGLVEAQQLDDTVEASVGSYYDDPDDQIIVATAKDSELITIQNEKSKVAQVAIHASFDQEAHRSSDHETDTSSAKPSFRTYVQVVAKLNREEAPIILGGLLLCILAGFVIPVQAVFFAECIVAISRPSLQYDKLRQEVNFWCLMFLMVAIVTFIAWIGQGLCFSYSTERLTYKARDRAFQSILRQNVGFFDQKKNSSGALTAVLVTSATDLTGLSGPIIGACLTFIVTLAAGIIMSIAIGWKLALVCTATIPIVTGCGYVRLRMLALFDSKIRKTHEEAAMYASEIVTAIRPVASLTLEDYVLKEYSAILARHAAKSLRSILSASTLYAASQSLSFFCAALAFWYGSTLLDNHEYNLLQFYICFATLISGAQVAGAVFSYAPDMSKALHAGRDLKALFERVPKIDTWNDTAGQPISQSSGRIDFTNVSFRYPTRPERLVLDGVSFQVQPGQYVALVGSSGSGKSTIIQLLERFFDPNGGHIHIDGQDISQLNVNSYRQLMSLVSQESTLYDGTIQENLLLGIDRRVDDAELVQACKEANIHAFITSLPDGFATTVGAAGVMLSGGQKQRIAIARALLRKTPILLLDEATSALDSESEKAVQEALDRVASHRTTIAVAHRLSTIQHADLICVLDLGQLVEKGTHSELMAKKGVYYDLVQLQKLETP